MLFGRDDKRDAGRPPLTVPLLPLRDIIVFPHQVVPLFVGREKSIAALKEAMAHKGPDDKAAIFLAAQKKAKTNDPGVDDIYAFGTLGHVIQLLPLPDGTVKVLVEGVKRARVRQFVRGEQPDRGEPAQQFFVVEVDEVEEQSEKTVELEALVRSVQSVFEAFVKLNKRIPPEMLMQVASIDDPARLADTIAVQLSLKLNDRQALLETENAAKRLEKLYELMQGEIEILQVEKKIRTRVKKQMEKTQKEYYLNEQMQAIQKELG
ncbi:MAG: LON peptidase substrate-binding domain-containing protein, partial [Myxococcaceae bacterium]